MITPCPHLDCGNRTKFGYCKTTACINPMHSNLGTAQYGQGVQWNIITNADRIRAMTDEELASFLFNLQLEAVVITMTPYDNFLDWLKKEADNG